MKIQNKFTYANVAATAALAIAVSGVGGAAYAAGVAKNSVGSPQIKNGAVKTVDLGKNSVTGVKVKNGSLAQADLNAKARNAFTAGADAYYDSLNFHTIADDDTDQTIFSMDIPTSNYLVSASGTIDNTGAVGHLYTCELLQPVGNDFTNTIAQATVYVAPDNDRKSFALDGIAIDSEGPITLECSSADNTYAANINDPRMVAVEVGVADEQ